MRITIELIGGPLNGIYSGDLNQTSTVLTWFHASNRGAVGQDFVVEYPASTATPQRHRYRVINCVQQDQATQIAAEYEGGA